MARQENSHCTAPAALIALLVLEACSARGNADAPPAAEGGPRAKNAASSGDGALAATPALPSSAPTSAGLSPAPPANARTPMASTAATATALRFVAFGDSRDNPDVHKAVVDAFATASPQLVLDTGDLWAGYGSTQWASITTANANIADLLNHNLYLVSRGNHESRRELLAFKPTLVRNNSEVYGFAYGNAYFVSLGMDPSAATAELETELQRPEAQSAAWRFVYSHYPIYDSGDGHGSDFAGGNPAIEGLCDKYHVAMYFSGHEHIYERSHQMFGQNVVDRGEKLVASAGTVYVVSGGGGAPFYSVSSRLPSSHITKTDVNHYVLVNATPTTLTADVFDTSGASLDHFQIGQ